MGRIEKLFRDHPSFAAGELEAQAEIDAGLLGYRVHGKMAPYWPEVASLLNESFGIACTIVGECITDIAIAAAAAGYNWRMDREIRSKFGDDVIASATREIERKRKKRR